MSEKTSFLQRSTMNKIDKFCGIENLSNFLNRFQNNKKPSNKLIILLMLHYYQSLYLYDVPVEDDYIEYRDTAIDTIAFLNSQKNIKDSHYVVFLISVINGGLDYTSKIKKLA